MLKTQIENYIKKAIDRGIDVDVEVFVPENEQHGHYSTNVALRLAKILKRNPIQIAESIKSQLEKQPNIFGLIKETKVVPPGFINFWLSSKVLQDGIKEILEQGDNFGQLNIGKGKKTLIEFISANPTGKLHLGHGRNAFFGDVLANVLTAAGYKVTREYYQNDAKASAQIKELGKSVLEQGEAYKSEYLNEIKSKIKNKLAGVIDPVEVGYIAAQAIFEDLEKFIKQDLKIKFDNIFHEQSLYGSGEIKKTENWLKGEKLLYQKDGAWWLKTSEYGDDEDRVAVRSDGTPTYLLPDIAYHKNKFSRGFSKVINILGADHQGHIKKLLAIQKILDYEGEFQNLFCQLVMLKTSEGAKKMSKRSGNVVEIDWLIKETGLDAARFFMLSRSLDTHMDFDLELAKEQSQKNPVFYVQYAHARICSILKKANSKSQTLKFNPASAEATAGKQNLKLLNQPSELRLIKELLKFPEILEDTAKDYQLQRLPQYATNLANLFHKFYEQCRVLNEDKELTQARLALAKSTQIVLKSVLSLMGVSAPEKM